MSSSSNKVTSTNLTGLLRMYFKHISTTDPMYFFFVCQNTFNLSTWQTSFFHAHVIPAALPVDGVDGCRRHVGDQKRTHRALRARLGPQKLCHWQFLVNNVAITGMSMPAWVIHITRRKYRALESTLWLLSKLQLAANLKENENHNAMEGQRYELSGKTPCKNWCKRFCERHRGEGQWSWF